MNKLGVGLWFLLGCRAILSLGSTKANRLLYAKEIIF